MTVDVMNLCNIIYLLIKKNKQHKIFIKCTWKNEFTQHYIINFLKNDCGDNEFVQCYISINFKHDCRYN